MIAGLLVAAAGTVSFAQADRNAEPVDRIEAIIPSAVRALPLENPQVNFQVRLDETGRLVEHMATSATHYQLIPAAETALRAAAFRPALANGRPILAVGQVTVTLYDPEQRNFFQGSGPMPFGQSATDAMQGRIYSINPEPLAYHRSKAGELDKPIEVASSKVMLYTDAAGKPAKGKCVVEYWVDADGAVKFPRIVSSDNEAVSLSALLTLQQTKFVPPTHNSLPTYVQVRQPMEFDTAPVPPAPGK
ncbi:MAG: TonB family protein [Lacunisphaera sp.]|nr:TonB family protein [Lacunisphaera sp.]